MKPFSAILVPLDGSATAAKSLGCAVWLASRLHAELHVLSVSDSPLPPQDELARLQVPAEFQRQVVLHQASGDPERAITEAIERHRVELAIITTHGASVEAGASEPPDPGQLVGSVARAIMEGSPVPVLLLPPSYVERLPWERMLVPVSGESYADDALELAVQFAHLLQLDIIVAHVADAQSGAGLAAFAHYADALHHEYPDQLEEFVRRALPRSVPAARRAIKEVALCRGDVDSELVALMEKKRVSLLVVGWRGSFMIGSARVLRALISEIRCPLLLVKPAPREPFRLKVGEQL